MEIDMQYSDILDYLNKNANATSAQGMARYGIKGTELLGVSIPILRKLACEYRRNHQLALKLWEKDMRETRILASMIADPDKVSDSEMEKMVKDFDSWEICDQTCMNLFEKTSFAYDKAREWTAREEEFVKRAGLNSPDI